MIKRNKHFNFLIFFVSVLVLFLTQSCFAGVLPSWNDSGAYKPQPVLFLHGFAKGNPSDWNPARTTLGKYFSKYSSIYSYLETINFQDPNGSVDTYDSGKLNPQGNPKGWSDKVQDKINELLSSPYGAYTTKLNLVCHSMGGLAARWYLANYSSNYVEKLILIGVPNLGSPLAESANALSKIPKLGWLTLVPVNSVMSFVRDNIDLYANAFSIDINGEAIDDLDNTPGGSGFIDKLNKTGQSSGINYYGIIGIDGSLANWVLFKDWYGGDSIVSKDSQLGTNSVSLRQSSQIYAIHWREPEIAAKTTDNKILQFLDSTPPEFTLDTPQENSTTEINTNSISIKGKVYKEYLPADSEIIISGLRQEDGAALNQINAPLKPSSLWIPNNPDSPVAEFDETIPFPGEGTYRISCQIKNPAGLTSDTKVFWVKVVLVQPNANIIVHGYNPEGKEITSITGFANLVAVYDGSARIGVAGNNPITIPSGHHTINVKFNGMTLTQEIDIAGGTTQELTFTFERVSVDVISLLSGSFSISDSHATDFIIPASFFDGFWKWLDTVHTDIFKSDKGVSIRSYGSRRYGEWAGGDPPYPPRIVPVNSNITVDVIYSPTSLVLNGVNVINIPEENTSRPAASIYAGGPVRIPGVISYFPQNLGVNTWYIEQNVSSYPDHNTIIMAVLWSESSGLYYGREFPITIGFHEGIYTGYPIGYYRLSIPVAFLSNSLELRLYKTSDQEYISQRASASIAGGSAAFSAPIMGGTTKISSVPYGPSEFRGQLP